MKKALILLLILITLGGTLFMINNNDEKTIIFNHDGANPNQEIIKYSFYSKILPSFNITSGKYKRNQEIILNNQFEIGIYNYEENKYSKITEYNESLITEQIQDVYVHKFDNEHIVFSVNLMRSLESSKSILDEIYIYDTKDKTLKNYNVLEDLEYENVKSGYQPRVIYNDNYLIYEMQNPENYRLSLYIYDTKSGEKRILKENAGLPLLVDNNLFYINLIENTDENYNDIMKCSDWKVSCLAEKSMRSNEIVIDFVVDNGSIFYLTEKTEGNNTKQMIYRDEDLIYEGDMTNILELIYCEQKLFLSGYSMDSIEYFDLETMQKVQIYSGNFNTNIFVESGSVFWLELDMEKEKSMRDSYYDFYEARI